MWYLEREVASDWPVGAERTELFTAFCHTTTTKHRWSRLHPLPWLIGQPTHFPPLILVHCCRPRLLREPRLALTRHAVVAGVCAQELGHGLVGVVLYDGPDAYDNMRCRCWCYRRCCRQTQHLNSPQASIDDCIHAFHPATTHMPLLHRSPPFIHPSIAASSSGVLRAPYRPPLARTKLSCACT